MRQRAARVAGRCSDRTSILIYIKPTLVGEEPVDLKHYHEKHADLPQHSTADQFFDDAQWECCRALGELIGSPILEAGEETILWDCLPAGLDWRESARERLIKCCDRHYSRPLAKFPRWRVSWG